MIRPKNQTEDLLLSNTKNCETLIHQTHRKAEQTFEFKMTKPRETFHFNPPIQIKGNWMIGLTDLEVYNSILKITEENNKFELYKFPDSYNPDISYTKIRDEIERDLGIADITAANLQHDIIAPIDIEEYREQVTKRMKDDKYMPLLAMYVDSVFQDFKNYLRTEIDLVEDDIKLVLYEHNSKFLLRELQPGNHTFKDVSEALFNILQSEHPDSSNVNNIEYDDITRRTKLVVRDGIIALRFDEKPFFSTILDFTSGWEYEHYNKYIGQNIANLSSTNKIHLKCDCINGSIQDGVRQPILLGFVLDKLSGYKVFCEPETIHYKKINKSVLKTIGFFLKEDNNGEVNFNGETLTFTLLMINI